MLRGVLVVAALLPAVVAVGCAQGNGSGPVADHCSLRDCGPTFGGSPDPLEDDTGVFDPGFDVGLADDTARDDPDSTAPADDSGPSADSGEALDSMVNDTGSAPIDSGSPPPIDSGCAPPAGKTCSTLPQCGCSATQNCDVSSLDGTTACFAAGSITLDGPCSDFGACARGLSCVGGVCVPFCHAPGDCAGPPGVAVACHAVEYVPSGSSTLTPIPGFDVCMVQCDPRNPTPGCGAGVGCDFADATTTLCDAAGTGIGADACDSDPSACAPGYTCVGISDTESDCVKWCRVGSSSDCPSGTTCNSFSEPLHFKTNTYGFCY